MPKPNENDPNLEPETETDEGEQDFEALYKQAQEDLKQARDDAEKWKKLSRQNEDRAKANFGAAKDLEEANAQMADLSKRLEALEGENTSLKASAARSALVKKVAKATGVPETIVSTLAAEDEKALTEAATAIAETYKPGGAPKTPEGGKFPRGKQPAEDSEEREFVRRLFGKE